MRTKLGGRGGDREWLECSGGEVGGKGAEEFFGVYF